MSGAAITGNCFVEYLAVQGIRSFSPDPRHSESIKFFRPITIILGCNGAGKT
eukprot:gene7377-6927_t